MEDEKQVPYDTPYKEPEKTVSPPPVSTQTSSSTDINNTQPSVEQPTPVVNSSEPYTNPLPPPIQPIQQTVQTNPAQNNEPQEKVSPGNIVLQWLTYAFWGWTILATSVLVSTVISSFVGDSNAGDFAAYTIAAVLVLFPISLVCDFFYSKQEPEHKHGAASIVMVIHAVIFALLGVGSLIAAVFSIVSMFVSSGDSTGSQIALYSSIIIAILYASVLVRTIFPFKYSWIRRAFMAEMIAVIGIVALLGVIGPVAKARVTRTDTLIENNLSTLQYAIEDYARDNDELPSTLSEITVDGDAKKLVDDNLVEYKANTKSSTAEIDKYGYNEDVNKTYYYQLCVNYKASKKDSYSSSYSSYDSKDGYSSYITTYGHPEGEVCYKLKTLGY